MTLITIPNEYEQYKSSQVKSSHIKSNQIKSNQIKSYTHIWETENGKTEIKVMMIQS